MNNMEDLLIGLMFLGAAAYLGRLVYHQFFGKDTTCAKGCGNACAHHLSEEKK